MTSRKGTSAIALVLAIVAGGLVLQRPAAATTSVVWTPTGPLPTAQNYVHLEGTPGDPLLDGRSFDVLPDVYDFQRYPYGNDDLSLFAFGDHDVDLLLSNDVDEHLSVGDHLHEVYPASGADVSISIDGSGCGSEGLGDFAVDEVSYEGDALTGIVARFDVPCDPASPSLRIRGVVSWHANAPVPPAPPHAKAVPTGALVAPAPSAGDGSHLSVHSPAGDPIGKGVDHEFGPDEVAIVQDGGGTISGGEHFASSDRWRLQIWPSSRSSAVDTGWYEGLVEPLVRNPRGAVRFEYLDHGCTSATDLAIDHLDLRGGTVQDLDVRMAVHCQKVPSSPALTATLHWEPTPAAGAPSSPLAPFVRPATDGAWVGWAPPASAGSAVTGYEVTTYLEGEAVRTTLAPAGALGTSITDLLAGRSYSFKVRAIDAAGPGFLSKAVGGVALTYAPVLGPHPSLEALVGHVLLDFADPGAAVDAPALVAAVERGERTPGGVVSFADRLPTWAAKRAVVTRLYRAFFDRIPDRGGLDHWTDRLEDGTKAQVIADQFARSSEFTRKYGKLSSKAFVQLIYTHVFGRPADADGLAYWASKLAHGTARGRFMLQQSESSEGIRRAEPQVDVVLAYRGMLRRVPTAAEVTAGASLLAAPDGADALGSFLIGSPQYAARF